MPSRKKKRSSGKPPVSAISQKSRSCAARHNEGLGECTNKHKPSGTAKTVFGRFVACAHTQALLAGSFLSSHSFSSKL